MAGCRAADSTYAYGFGSPRLLGRSQAAAACPWGGAGSPSGNPDPARIPPLHPHPQTSGQDAEEEKGWKLPGCFVLRPLCGARGHAGSRNAPGGEPAIPPAKVGINIQEQQAPLPRRLQHKSGSFQLTLSPHQPEEGIMLEFARGKNKIRRDF